VDVIRGYTRVSTLEQAKDDRTSLDEQRRRIVGAALMQGHATEPVIYSDEGVSGSIPLTKREAGARLWSELQHGDIVIAAKLDRIFRSAEDALVTARQLQERGVHLILTDMGSDPVTGNGNSRLFFTMLAGFAEWERWRIAERMNDGRQGKKRKGGHIGGSAPYGYRVEGKMREARLIPIEAEQATISEARRLRNTGMTLRAVSHALVAAGRLNRHGKPFTPVQVERMVKREARQEA
jgi:DNA invertase Pin-like site-specific DNA recombinase